MSSACSDPHASIKTYVRDRWDLEGADWDGVFALAQTRLIALNPNVTQWIDHARSWFLYGFLNPEQHRKMIELLNSNGALKVRYYFCQLTSFFLFASAVASANYLCVLFGVTSLLLLIV
jgi:hypothetical protein